MSKPIIEVDFRVFEQELERMMKGEIPLDKNYLLELIEVRGASPEMIAQMDIQLIIGEDDV